MAEESKNYLLQSVAKGRSKNIGDYQYNAEEIVGRGSFASVYVGYKQNNKTTKYAIKVINHLKLEGKQREALDKEIEIHRQISNQAIIRMYDIIRTENHYYLILEYCEGKDLYSYIKSKGKRPEKEVQHMIHSLKPAFQYLYERKIMHRDIKLKNLLRIKDCEYSQIKVCDFGTARKLEIDLASTYTGTPLNMAPEIMLYQGKYNEKVDLWSVGTVIYELITGSPLYKAENIEVLKEQVKSVQIGTLNIECTEYCRKVILSLLKVNPQERWGWKELLESDFVSLENDAYSEKYIAENPFEASRDENISEYSKEVEAITVTMKANYDTLIELFNECNSQGEIKSKASIYCLLFQSAKDLANMIALVSNVKEAEKYQQTVKINPILRYFSNKKEKSVDLSKIKLTFNPCSVIVPLYKKILELLSKFGDVGEIVRGVNLKTILTLATTKYNEAIASSNNKQLRQADLILSMLIMYINSTIKSTYKINMQAHEYWLTSEDGPTIEGINESLIKDINKLRADIDKLLGSQPVYV